MATEAITAGTADNDITVTDAVFATARAATTGTLGTASAINSTVQSDLNAGTYTIRRYFLPFTSAVSGTVTAVTLTFTANSIGGVGAKAHAVESSQAATVVAGDFDNVVFTSFGSVNLVSTGSKTITFNATGITYINNHLGSTILLAIIEDHDVTNTAPVSAGTARIQTADNTGVKPILTITYTPVDGGSASNFFMML